MSAQATPLTIKGRRCRLCGYGEVTPAAIEAYAAASGTDQAGAMMREAMVRRGIAVAAADDVRERCPSCESDDIVDYCWKLNDSGQVEPATVTPLKETG